MSLLETCEADLIVTGHTHIPLDKQVEKTARSQYVGVPNSHMLDQRAWYGIFEADEHGYQIEQCVVEYDVTAIIDAIRASSHPTLGFLLSYFQGKQISKIFSQAPLDTPL